jgi:predicted phosphodiesterase
VRLLLAAAIALPSLGCGSGGGAAPLDPAAHFPAGVVRGPILALPTSTSMTVAWWSDTRVLGSVAYGLDASYGTTVTDATARFEHVNVLTGLRPATTYHYRIERAGVPAGGDHVFTTPPDDPVAPVRFGVLGDTGTGGPEELAVIALLERQAPDLVLHVGDLAYEHGTTQQVFQRFTVPFAGVMDHRPLFAAVGNHDVETDGGRPFFDAVVQPTNPVDGTESYYSLDWGGCHVVALDSTADLSPQSPQATWLASDLQASTARWKLVFFHHPVWSSSSHGGSPDLQASLGPVLEAHGVDLVLCGHDHDYERTFPMVGATPVDVGFEPDYHDPAGPIYVVTGGGGQTLYGSGAGSFTAASESAYHVTVIDVAGSTLSITAVALDGTVIDRASISK